MEISDRKFFSLLEKFLLREHDEALTRLHVVEKGKVTWDTIKEKENRTNYLETLRAVGDKLEQIKNQILYKENTILPTYTNNGFEGELSYPIMEHLIKQVLKTLRVPYYEETITPVPTPTIGSESL